MDCSAGDMANVMAFTKRMVALATYRADLSKYLGEKMQAVAPNLSTLVGDSVGARLIAKAGSLASLAKCPASTVQILGAEKALFRALKKKGNTPKYGLIYHSSFIGRAHAKLKGRISRYLANKCAIASRIDNFSEEPTTKFGLALRKQVEDRLDFYATGAAPQKNEDAMKSAMDAVLGDIKVADPTADADMADIAPRAIQKQEKKSKDKKEKSKDKELKKDKKRRHSE